MTRDDQPAERAPLLGPPEFDDLGDLERVVAKARISLPLTDEDIAIVDGVLAPGSVGNPNLKMLRLLEVTLAMSAKHMVRTLPPRLCSRVGRYLDVLIAVAGYELSPGVGRRVGSTFERWLDELVDFDPPPSRNS